MVDGPPLLPGGSSCPREAPSSPSLHCGAASLPRSSVNPMYHTLLHSSHMEKSPSVRSRGAFLCVF